LWPTGAVPFPPVDYFASIPVSRGRLSIIKTLNYYLERNRVAGAPLASGTSTYSTIFLPLQQAAAEERQHMQLLQNTTFRYLGHRGIPGSRQDVGMTTHNGSNS
jgi:chitin synthase